MFFLTNAKLVPLDTDTAIDLYDAHECSSIAPCFSTVTESYRPCSFEASCKALPTPEPGIFGTPASATFSGLGNLVPTPNAKTPADILVRELARALNVCRSGHGKRRRVACERVGRKRYGAHRARRVARRH